MKKFFQVVSLRKRTASLRENSWRTKTSQPKQVSRFAKIAKILKEKKQRRLIKKRVWCTLEQKIKQLLFLIRSIRTLCTACLEALKKICKVKYLLKKTNKNKTAIRISFKTSTKPKAFNETTRIFKVTKMYPLSLLPQTAIIQKSKEPTEQNSCKSWLRPNGEAANRSKKIPEWKKLLKE